MKPPVAETCEDGLRIVKYTHDVLLAEILMRNLLGCHSEIGCCETEGCYTTGCTGYVQLPPPKRVFVRVLPSREYLECERGPGAFPAVVFND